MKRVTYYVTPEQLFHLAENYNIHVTLIHNSRRVYVYPTDAEATLECVMLGVYRHDSCFPLETLETILGLWNNTSNNAWHELVVWLKVNENACWLTVSDSGFITYYD